MSTNLKENLHEIKEKASHYIHETKDKAYESSKQVAQKVDAEVHKDPWKFIGIAALFAMIFGFFFGRKSKH